MAAKWLPVAVAFAKKVDAGDKKALTNPEHIEARGMMLNAAMMGGVAFREDLGVTHSCAHALSTVCDLHHGLANGIVLPYAMAFNKDVSGDKMAWMATAVRAKNQTADGFIEWIASFKAELGIPRALGEVGVKRAQMDKLVDVAFADSCHQFNPKPVSAQDFRGLFDKALGA